MLCMLRSLRRLEMPACQHTCAAKWRTVSIFFELRRYVNKSPHCRSPFVNCRYPM